MTATVLTADATSTAAITTILESFDPLDTNDIIETWVKGGTFYVAKIDVPG